MTMLKLVGFLRSGSSLGPRSTSSWCMSKHQFVFVVCSSTSTANKPAPSEIKPVKVKSKFPMIETAFTSLMSETSDKNENFQETLASAKTVDDLLKVSEQAHDSRTLMMLIVSTLNQWIEDKKITREDFESDERYLQLCIKLKINKKSKRDPSKNDVMPVSPNPYARRGDFQNLIKANNSYDSAINKLNSREAVDVWTGLTSRSTREKPLLEALAAYLVTKNDKLNMKQNSDLLYGMAKLNFPNDALLKKICEEIVTSVKNVTQSSVIGSIITSLGMLKYRNPEVMNALAIWAVENKQNIRTQDVCSFLMTLATIGYKPINSDTFFNELVYTLNETDMIRSTEWLDIVWALTTLNQASAGHIESVLNDKFIGKLYEHDDIVPVTKKIKLLNINATAKYLMKHYTGPLLPPESPIFDVPIAKTKEKEIFVRAIKDTLATLFPSRDHFRENIDDRTGFLIDLDFFMDKNLTPIPYHQISNKNNLTRVAIVANSYQNYCRGETMLTGPVRLHYRLLQAQKCQILDISYLDFHTADILLKRITYINNRIQAIFRK